MISSKVLIALFFVICIILQVSCTDDVEDADDGKTYDYIVVGIGQSGSVVASRLAEVKRADGSYKYQILGLVPGVRTHRSLNGTDYVASDWTVDSNGNYVVQTPFTRFDVPFFSQTISIPPAPYPAAQVLVNGKPSTVTVAHLLGGAGVHNGHMWNRHSVDQINGWGVDGWSYEDVLPFYKKTENVTASRIAINPTLHGLTGPIQVSDNPQRPIFDIITPLLQSCEAQGLPYNFDFNGVTKLGCGEQVYNIGQGVRYSAANAYLPPVMKQGNLHLKVGVWVTKILIKAGATATSNPVAYGIEYSRNGKTKTALLNEGGEIILAGSAYFTPALLQLSGIGPAAELRALDIPVWVNNPNVGVGINGNHALLGLYNYSRADFETITELGHAAVEYAINKTGPFCYPTQIVYAYMCSDGRPNSQCTNPDVMVGTEWGGSWTVNPPDFDFKTLGTQVSSANTQSKGVVRLQSNDPFALPNITYNPFSNPADMQSLVYGFQFIRKWFASPPWNKYIDQEIFPGPEYETDAELEAFLKTYVTGLSHACGGCNFGNEGDSTRVTDPQMRVVGVDGLRIADSSVLPTSSSHLQASSAMTAERCADFIING